MSGTIQIEKKHSSQTVIVAETLSQKYKAERTPEDVQDTEEMAITDEHRIPLPQLFERLHLDNPEQGLKNAQIEGLREQYGRNVLTPPKVSPWYVLLCHELTGFFSLLLWFGAALCFIGYGLKNEMDNIYIGSVLTVVVIVTGVFSYIQNRNANDLMASFKDMLPPQCTVMRDGQSSSVEASELVPGDIVMVKAGDKIPADIRVLTCSDDYEVDNASLTGESEPQKRKREFTDDNPLETKNLCFFGTLVPKGKCTGIVIKTGDDTVMGRIAKISTQQDSEPTPIAVEIEHFVKIVSAVAIFLGVSFFLISVGLGTDLVTNLVFMIGIIVANVPEGLLATVTVCLSLTAKKMATKNVLVKNMQGVETLGSTTCICSDKTGTLTQNVMTVTNVVYDNKIWDCESSMYSIETINQDDPSYQALAKCACLCNNATFDVNSKMDKNGNLRQFKDVEVLGDGSTEIKIQWKTIGDATESGLIKFLQSREQIGEVDEFREQYPKVTEIPFNSTNKFQLTICHGNAEQTAPMTIFMKGAPEKVLGRCDHLLSHGKVIPLTQQHMDEIADLQETLSKKGMRVLGFAQKELPLDRFDPQTWVPDIDAINFPFGEERHEEAKGGAPHKQFAEEAHEKLVYIGMTALIDPPRPQVPGAVISCMQAGIKVYMVTGDHPTTAKAIAYKVNILRSPTREDLVAQNAKNNLQPGDNGYIDPESAQALVVPGASFPNPPIKDKDSEDKKETDEQKEQRLSYEAAWDDILKNHPQIVFARTSPAQKLQLVENCQRLGEIVAVTGDGVNDSPALSKAHIGIAMGIMGTDVSKEAADMILMDDNFASIVEGTRQGRIVFQNLKKSIAYTLSSNIPEIAPFLSFITVAVPLPLSTPLILAVDLGTDMIPAISMAFEGAESTIMQEPPRDQKKDRLVTRKLVVFAYLQIGVIQAAAGFFTWMVVLNDYGYPPHVLPGLGALNQWGRQVMFCKLEGGRWVHKDCDINVGCEHGKDYRYDEDGNPDWRFQYWHQADDGEIVECVFPIANYRGPVTANDEPAGYDYVTPSSFSAHPDFTYEMQVPTAQVFLNLLNRGYYPYMPYRARYSPFYNSDWEWYHVQSDELSVPSTGPAKEVYPVTAFTYQLYGEHFIDSTEVYADEEVGYSGYWCDAATRPNNAKTTLRLNGTKLEGIEVNCEKLYKSARLELTDTVLGFTEVCDEDGVSLLEKNANTLSNRVASRIGSTGSGKCSAATAGATYHNVLSRMFQKEALHHAQAAYFITIIVVQWADLLICKTRWLSIRHQGLSNNVMNFGIMFETLLGACLSYIPDVARALTTRDIRLTHWFAGIPFSVFILMYDETRKYIMRTTSIAHIDQVTGQMKRSPGWLERNTLY
jgi:sodium/potassium-transporting ATPase subunit alpha